MCIANFGMHVKITGMFFDCEYLQNATRMLGNAQRDGRL